MIAEQQPVAESSDSDIEGPINFLARLPLYATVKPYAFRHKPNNGCPATNMENETHRVMIRNMRSGKPSYEQCGFTFCRMSSKMTYEQYNDFKLIESVHFPEIEAVLKEVLGFKYARIVNWGDRKRHASFPIATGEAYEYMQPASRSHIDFSMKTCTDTIRRIFKAEADEFMGKRWQYVNIWHPLRGPLYDWPLAVCDASTVDFSKDVMASDVVGFDREIEELQLQYEQNQQWYYLPAQMPDELLIFKLVDGQANEGASFGTPHSAFDFDTYTGPVMPRESIEMRALVTW